MQPFRIQRVWQSKNLCAVFLLPLSLVYGGVVSLRGWLYKTERLKSQRLPVPVIVVGNITVGGSGKTPLVNWLALFLKKAGFKPGIISRGYKGKATVWPQIVTPDSNPQWVGDEPVLLARNSDCPVVVGPARIETAEKLLSDFSCDVLISDDGLQHLKMERDIEISLVDGEKRYGNGWLLPAGPLREPMTRLDSVDLQVCLGEPQANELGMLLTSSSFRMVRHPEKIIEIDSLQDEKVHAVAAIGNPQRFFTHLRQLGLKVTEHAFADHHWFKPADIDFHDAAAIIMTEKDAVKCEPFATDRCMFLPVTADPDPKLGEILRGLLNQNAAMATQA